MNLSSGDPQPIFSNVGFDSPLDKASFKWCGANNAFSAIILVYFCLCYVFTVFHLWLKRDYEFLRQWEDGQRGDRNFGSRRDDPSIESNTKYGSNHYIYKGGGSNVHSPMGNGFQVGTQIHVVGWTVFLFFMNTEEMATKYIKVLYPIQTKWTFSSMIHFQTLLTKAKW